MGHTFPALMHLAGGTSEALQHFRSFASDLLVKALSQPLNCHSCDNGLRMDLSKVIEMCLNHGSLFL